jgi:hypothetical protein
LPGKVIKINKMADCWLMPIILATQEAEIRMITVQSQLGQIAHETLSQKYSTQNKV